MINNKWIAVAVILLAFYSATLKAQDNIIDEIIWVVGDDAILKSDVENARLEMQRSGERIPGDPYCVIPEQMAIQKLYIHQAKLDSVDIAESDITQYVDRWLNGAIKDIGSREKLEEYLNKPISQIREERRETVRDALMTQEVQKKIVGNVKLTPSDVRRYYSSISQDSLPFIPTMVEVSIVTAEPKISLTEIDHVKERLRDFTDQVNKGETEFSTLAWMYSEDPASYQSGGELGFLGKGTLLPEFAAVAFSLNDPKKVSRIVETEYGFHIIQLIEKRGDRINVRHILLKPKVSQEELNAASLQLDSIRMDIENKKFTFEEAATYLSADKDTRNNKGLMVNLNPESDNAGTARFELEELPPEIGKVIYGGMKEGEVSKPFIMVNSKQKQVVAMIKLKSKVEGHKANISDDYQALRAIVEGRKRQEILNKWIAQKQKETYIRIHDNWKNCDFQLNGWVK